MCFPFIRFSRKGKRGIKRRGKKRGKEKSRKNREEKCRRRGGGLDESGVGEGRVERRRSRKNILFIYELDEFLFCKIYLIYLISYNLKNECFGTKAVRHIYPWSFTFPKRKNCINWVAGGELFFYVPIFYNIFICYSVYYSNFCITEIDLKVSNYVGLRLKLVELNCAGGYNRRVIF